MPTAQTSPALKAPTFNPKSFSRDFTALAVQNPKQAAKMAGDWRMRLENALIEAETAAEMSLQLATIGGSNLAFSTLSGYQGAKKAAIETEWGTTPIAGVEATATQKAYAEWRAANPNATAEQIAASDPFKDGKVKDPTKMLGIPTTVWLVGGTGLLAWATRNSDQGVLARGLATGALTTATGELGQNFGKKMFEKKTAKK